MLVFWYEIEMQIMDWFYKIGNDFLTYLFYFISQFGGSIVVIGILGVTYWIIDKEKGERLGFAVFTSIGINGILKSMISFKRPFQYENQEYLRKLENFHGLKDSATGSSFPSGHSQNGSSLYMTLILLFKQKWVLIVSIILMILIPISRLYLGVHFPSDVIIGVILGISIAILTNFLYTKFKNNIWIIYLIILAILTVFILLPQAEHDLVRGYGLYLGLFGGTLVEKKYIVFEPCKKPLNKFLRLLIGAAIVGTIFILVNLLPHDLKYNKLVTIISYFLVCFSALAIVPMFFKNKFNKKGL